MDSLPLDLQLNVDSAAGDLSAVAFDWLEGVSARLAGGERLALDGLPARTAPARGGRYGPLGEPGSLFGIVTVERGGDDTPPHATERNCSAAGLRWLRAELADLPPSATLWIGRLDEHGARSGGVLLLDVGMVPGSPGWLRLGARIDERDFTDPVAGGAEQRRWLDVMEEYADRLNPGFGHVAYAYSDGATALEDCLHPADQPPEARDPRYTIGQSRQTLRGYSWLTIVAAELVPSLGGPDAVADSGAFAQVKPLAGGGLWLLATADYRHYTGDVPADVHRVLSPVLRRGLPRPRRQLPGKPPHPIVFADAGGDR